MQFVRVSWLLVLALFVLLAVGAGAVPGTTERLSVNGSGTQGNRDSDAPAMSADARYVAFASEATGLVANDGNGVKDIFLRDRQSNTIERVSLDSNGSDADGFDTDRRSEAPDVSDDGRYVVFESLAEDLIGVDTDADLICDVGCDTNDTWDIYLRDRQTNTNERISVSSAGVEAAGGPSLGASITADGRYVAFHSTATNLVVSDLNANSDVFLRDRQTNTTTRVSVTSAEVEGDLGSDYAAISANGLYVAFASFAGNLAADDDDSFFRDIFVRDLLAGTTEYVSKSTSGTAGNWESSFPSISSDGRYVAFESQASSLVSGDTNTCPTFLMPGTCPDAFVRDRQTNTTTRVSVGDAGAQSDGASTSPSISDDGRYVSFASEGSTLVTGDGNALIDVFEHDRTSARTTRLSLDTTAGDPDADSFPPASASGGRLTAFPSDAENLVAGDSNTSRDVFLHTLADSDADANWDPFDNCPYWANPTQTLPMWTVPPGDQDCDGYTDAAEGTIGTLPLQQCPLTLGGGDEDPDAWPPDMDDSRAVNISDVLALKPSFGQSVPPAPARHDLAPSGSINISDILQIKPVFGKSCT